MCVCESHGQRATNIFISIIFDTNMSVKPTNIIINNIYLLILQNHEVNGNEKSKR